MYEPNKLEVYEMSKHNNFGKCGFCNSEKGHFMGCPKIGGLSDREAIMVIHNGKKR